MIHRVSDSDTNCEIAIWQTEESISFFLERIQLFPFEVEEISKLNNKKTVEWLSTRYLLHLLTKNPKRLPCIKDEYGKPYLDTFDGFISLSHSREYAAALTSSKSAGIDIQVITPKINAISSKFVNEIEKSFIKYDSEIYYNHAIWGAKEVIFKAYGKKEVDFKKHIHICAFEFNPLGFSFKGFFKKDQMHTEYHLYCQQINQIILVYGTEVNTNNSTDSSIKCIKL